MSAPFDMPRPALCVFCEMTAGRLDKGVVEETALTFTIVNQRQFETGQALVIPRRHAPTLLDLTDEEATAVMAATRRLAAALVAAYAPDGITVYQNNGVASLQEVPHFHMHVVPRRKQGGWGDGPPHIAALESPSRDAARKALVGLDRERQIAAQIRAKL